MFYNRVSRLEIDIYTCMKLDYIRTRTKESGKCFSFVSRLDSRSFLRFVRTNTYRYGR